MKTPQQPAGGKPANLQIGTPITFNSTSEAARLRDFQILAAWHATDSPAEIARRAAVNKRRIAAMKKGGLL